MRFAPVALALSCALTGAIGLERARQSLARPPFPLEGSEALLPPEREAGRRVLRREAGCSSALRAERVSDRRAAAEALGRSGGLAPAASAALGLGALSPTLTVVYRPCEGTFVEPVRGFPATR